MLVPTLHCLVQMMREQSVRERRQEPKKERGKEEMKEGGTADERILVVRGARLTEEKAGGEGKG